MGALRRRQGSQCSSRMLNRDDCCEPSQMFTITRYQDRLMGLGNRRIDRIGAAQAMGAGKCCGTLGRCVVEGDKMKLGEALKDCHQACSACRIAEATNRAGHLS